jgi:hypothetical protein
MTDRSRRNGDPHTSGSPHEYQRTDPRFIVEYVKRKLRASQKGVEEIESLMKDGAPRHDQDIHACCRERGYKKSESTIRHSRLVLSIVDILRDTGEVRLTKDGKPSIVWRFNPDWTEATAPSVEEVDRNPEIHVRPPKNDVLLGLANIRKLIDHAVVTGGPDVSEELIRLGRWLVRIATVKEE